MVNICCVEGCKRELDPSSGLSTHRFPTDPELKRKWLEVVPAKITKSSVVCSLHFKPDDFSSSALFRRKLKHDSIPSLFPIIQKYKMNRLPACRVCLAYDSRLCSIMDGQLRDIYETLVKTSSLDTDDMLPTSACYICLSFMKKILKFRDRLQKANQILQQMIISGMEPSVSSLDMLVKDQTGISWNLQISDIDTTTTTSGEVEIKVKTESVKSEMDIDGVSDRNEDYSDSMPVFKDSTSDVEDDLPLYSDSLPEYKDFTSVFEDDLPLQSISQQCKTNRANIEETLGEQKSNGNEGRRRCFKAVYQSRVKEKMRQLSAKLKNKTVQEDMAKVADPKENQKEPEAIAAAIDDDYNSSDKSKENMRQLSAELKNETVQEDMATVDDQKENQKEPEAIAAASDDDYNSSDNSKENMHQLCAKLKNETVQEDMATVDDQKENQKEPEAIAAASDDDYNSSDNSNDKTYIPETEDEDDETEYSGSDTEKHMNLPYTNAQTRYMRQDVEITDYISESIECNGVAVVTDPSSLVRSPESEKRKRERDFCFYCESFVLNFARHVFRNHPAESEVQKALSAPKNSRLRKNILTDLRKKGNFIIHTQNQSFKPMKKVRYSRLEDYLPCTKCLGLYSRKQLWKHKKKCNETYSNSTVQIDAQNFLLRNYKVNQKLKDRVFPRIRPNKISRSVAYGQISNRSKS